VLMPAFNERASIRRMAEDVLAQGIERLIVVDDGCSDGTSQALAGLDLDLLVHPRNLGKGCALATGMRHALAHGYGRVVTIDADGQHRPGDIPRLVAASLEHPQAIVIAARVRRRDSPGVTVHLPSPQPSPPRGGGGERLPPGWRRFGNEVADFWISWACGRPILDTQSGFRLYPALALAAVPMRPRPGQGFAFESGLLIDLVHAGMDLSTVAIETLYDDASRASHYRPWRDTWSIVRLVGAHLLRRGLYPVGLMRSLGWLPPFAPQGGHSSQVNQR